MIKFVLLIIFNINLMAKIDESLNNIIIEFLTNMAPLVFYYIIL